MRARNRWCSFVVVLCIGLPICESRGLVCEGKGPAAREPGEYRLLTPKPKSKTSFHPGWRVSRWENGDARRLVAYPRHWDPKALQDLEDLEHLDSLESLRLTKTGADDETLKVIGKIESLRELWLGQTKITDAGMAHLAKLTNLKTLVLSDTRISDEGLKHLHGIPWLKDLVTHHTRVTEKGLQALEALRPNFEAVRFWDVTWEEFDNALLLRTPHFDLIQDFPCMKTGFCKPDYIQVSGPKWPPAFSKTVHAQKHTLRRGRSEIITIVADATDKNNELCIKSVRIGKQTFPITNPARTYVVDGQGKIKPADFSLRFDETRRLWLESPSNPKGPGTLTKDLLTQKKKPTPGSVIVSKDAASPIKSNVVSAYASMLVEGGWNGKHVVGLVDAKEVWKEEPVHGSLFPQKRNYFEYHSDAGIIFVFLHVPHRSLHMDYAYDVRINSISGPLGKKVIEKKSRSGDAIGGSWTDITNYEGKVDLGDEEHDDAVIEAIKIDFSVIDSSYG